MSGQLWELGAAGLLSAYRAHTASPRDVVAELAERISAIDVTLGAFTALTLERASEEARALTEDLARDRWRGPLHGVPVAIKELFDVEDANTTFGSMVFKDRVASRDAEAVRRLRAAGAIVLGLTRSHEFGWGITTQHATRGGTRNPWDLDRVPGGSSGGSAAAVAAGLVPIALGSDTGGSIRIPSAFCGIAGLKPTFGRVSKRGAVALAPTLDHPGPLARTVEDCARMFEVLAGYDAGDPSTVAAPQGFQSPDNLAGLRVGISRDLHLRPLSADYIRVFEAALRLIEAAGATVRELRVEEAGQIRPTFATIQMAEAYDIHTRVLETFPSRESEYGPDVRGRLVDAAGVGIGSYLAARERAVQFRRQFDLLFEEVEVLVTPVAAGGPSTVGKPDQVEHLGVPLPFRDLVMDYTVPQNLTGLPSCCVRAGFDSEGLPVGLQVTAPAFHEGRALTVAGALESALGGDRRWPAAAVRSSVAGRRAS